MKPTLTAITWIGIICALALILSLVGILAMIIVPPLKDPEAMKSLLTVAGIAGSGVIGLVGYIGGGNGVEPINRAPHTANQVPAKPILT